MAVEQLAQVVFNAERKPPGDHPPPVHEPPAREHEQRDRAGDQRQFVTRARLRRGLVVLGPVPMICTARPVRAGSATVITIARLASVQEMIMPRL